MSMSLLVESSLSPPNPAVMLTPEFDDFLALEMAIEEIADRIDTTVHSIRPAALEKLEGREGRGGIEVGWEEGGGRGWVWGLGR